MAGAAGLAAAGLDAALGVTGATSGATVFTDSSTFGVITFGSFFFLVSFLAFLAVSYTHLDVYKRQHWGNGG